MRIVGLCVILCLLAPILVAAPETGQDYFKLGVNCYRRGLYDEAMGAFIKASTLEPALKEKANFYMGRVQAALQKALDEKIKEAERHFKAGQEYYANGELRKALVEFEEACALNPGDERAQSYLARVETELSGERAKEAQAPTEEGYIIGPDDILTINVVGRPELSGQFIVGPDGYIPFPYLRKVKAAGLTRYQLADLLMKELSKYYTGLAITVDIYQYGSRKVLVLGEVYQPGEYPMTKDRMTVRDAVVMAGLPLPTAATRRVHIIKPNTEKPEYKIVNLYNVLYKGLEDDNVELEPGDIVYVPSTVLSKVNQVLDQLLNPASRAAQLTQIYEQYRHRYWHYYYKYYEEYWKSRTPVWYP